MNDLDFLNVDDLIDPKELDLLAANGADSTSDYGSVSGKVGFDAKLTLESILNEDDDEQNDLILKKISTAQNLNALPRSASLRAAENEQSFRVDLLSILSSSEAAHSSGIGSASGNGNACKQIELEKISKQLLAAINRSDSGRPTALTVAAFVVVGTSRGFIFMFDAHEALKLYISPDDLQCNEAITCLSLNKTCERLLVGNAFGLCSHHCC